MRKKINKDNNNNADNRRFVNGKCLQSRGNRRIR